MSHTCASHTQYPIAGHLSPSRRRRYLRSPLLGGIELLAAEYGHHVFPRHAQESVVIGLVERGVIQVTSGALTHLVREGDLLFIAPETVHEAAAHLDSTWTYRALYLSDRQWREVCGTAHVAAPTGAFVVADQKLYQRARRAHERLISGVLSERALVDTLRILANGLRRPSDAVPEEANFVTSDGSLERVRRLLDAELTRRVTLNEMVAMAGMSRFHFVRAFTRCYGVSPYAYSVNRRLLEARRSLSRGEGISMTALHYGFADQAHLTRHFLRTIGVTPGEYRRAFADARHLGRAIAF